MAKRDDDLKDSYYLYIMRNSIGAGLKSLYSTDGDMPDRIAALLQELDEAESHGPGDRPCGEKQPTRRHGRRQ